MINHYSVSFYFCLAAEYDECDHCEEEQGIDLRNWQFGKSLHKKHKNDLDALLQMELVQCNFHFTADETNSGKHKR